LICLVTRAIMESSSTIILTMILPIASVGGSVV
jgi:hypothetical protein